MNNYRSSLIALTALLSLLLLFFMLRPIKQNDLRRDIERLQVFRIDPDGVRKFSVKTRSSEFTVEKINDKSNPGQWQFTKPKRVPVDRNLVEWFLKTLPQFRATRWVSNSPTDLNDPKRFGFDEPQMVISFETESLSKTFIVGSRSHVAQEFFARVEDGHDLYIVDNALFERLNHPFENFRGRALLDFDSKDIVSFTIHTARGTWTAVRESEHEPWRVAQPKATLTLDAKKVDVFLSGLSRLRAEDFVADDPKPEDLKRLGLQPAPIAVQLHTADGKEIGLRLSATRTLDGKQKIYATSTQAPSIVALSSYFVEKITRDPSEYIAP